MAASLSTGFRVLGIALGLYLVVGVALYFDTWYGPRRFILGADSYTVGKLVFGAYYPLHSVLHRIWPATTDSVMRGLQRVGGEPKRESDGKPLERLFP